MSWRRDLNWSWAQAASLARASPSGISSLRTHRCLMCSRACSRTNSGRTSCGLGADVRRRYSFSSCWLVPTTASLAHSAASSSRSPGEPPEDSPGAAPAAALVLLAAPRAPGDSALFLALRLCRSPGGRAGATAVGPACARCASACRDRCLSAGVQGLRGFGSCSAHLKAGRPLCPPASRLNTK